MRSLKRVLESATDEEIVAHVRVSRYRRSDMRRGYRNGYRHRSLFTEFGLLEEIRVPRDREGSYQPRVLPRYQRRQHQVDRMVRRMFLSRLLKNPFDHRPVRPRWAAWRLYLGTPPDPCPKGGAPEKEGSPFFIALSVG